MKEKLLELAIEGDNVRLFASNNEGDSYKIVMGIVNTIWREFIKRNNRPLDILFAVVVHLLSQDLTGKFEEDFINNLRKTTPQYRENYAKFIKTQKQN